MAPWRRWVLGQRSFVAVALAAGGRRGWRSGQVGRRQTGQGSDPDQTGSSGRSQGRRLPPSRRGRCPACCHHRRPGCVERAAGRGSGAARSGLWQRFLLPDIAWWAAVVAMLLVLRETVAVHSWSMNPLYPRSARGCLLARRVSRACQFEPSSDVVNAPHGWSDARCSDRRGDPESVAGAHHLLHGELETISIGMRFPRDGGVTRSRSHPARSAHQLSAIAQRRITSTDLASAPARTLR